MKVLKWIIIVSLIVIIGAISIAFLYLQSSRPVYHGELHIKGISNQVKIYFDNYGIPHIVAQNEKDAYFALGYVQAQERLFQMELLRRISAGRLSEVLGEDMIPVDAFFRTLGIYKSAREAAAMFFSKPEEPWQHNTLSYLRGVNAFIASGPTPPEFVLLQIPKEKFTPEDIYLITGYMSFSFAEALKTDPILDKINRRLGASYLNAFNWGESTGSHSNATDSTILINDSIASFASLVTDRMPLSPWLGSNGWVLAPSRSVSGKVLFANDTHIGYQQPAVWYEAHIEYPGFHLYGKYLAGMPFPLIGHNREITWGLTMFENDDMNLYREKSDGKFPGKYFYKGRWENFRSKTETILVKNKPDTTFVVRESVHGPVINDVLPQLDSTDTNPVAVWWTYTRFPATALQVTYELATSGNMDNARKAASKVNAPGLNILYGDAAGNIAMWSAAKLPIYPAGINTKTILDGESGEHDILGYYDFTDNPQIENPASGVIVSANQPPLPVRGLNYPGYYAPYDRVNRIDSLLATKEKWSLKDLEVIVNDATSTVQAKNAYIILDVLQGDTVLTASEVHIKAARALISWTGSHLLKDIAPGIYYKIIANIFKLTFEDELGENDYKIIINSHLMKNSYTSILLNDSSQWWDNIHTAPERETRKQIFSRAFSSAVADMVKANEDIANWSWGGIHTVEHVHPVGRKSPLDKIFNVGPFPVRGGIETINNAGFPLEVTGSFKVSYGPAMRTLIDFKNLDNGLSVLPTGQSGHVRSPHYHDQTSLHLAGKFRPMIMNKTRIETKSTSILTLRPQ